MIDERRLPNPDQIASAVESVVSAGAAAGCRAIDIRVWNGIELRLLPDRGLDIGAASYRGTPIAWISQTGEQAPPAADVLTESAWGDHWGGGLVTTCGLSNVGAPSDGHGLHGSFTARAATAVVVDRTTSEITVTGTIADPPFTLSRRIVTAVGEGIVRIDDRVVNDSEWTAAAPLLYHVNVGAPLWDDGAVVETDASDVVPRDADAASGLDTWDMAPEPLTDAPERVFEQVGATWSRISNPRLGLELVIRSSQPRMWQWVARAAGTYALALEPANCSVLGRAHDIATGRMPFLDPGESRTSWLTIEARSTT